MRACVLAMVLALACPAVAHAHAQLLSTQPPPGARLKTAPATVTLTFNEPVRLLRSRFFDVVDQRGRSVAAAPERTSPRDAARLVIALRPRLAAGTYTVRYRVESADAHVMDGVATFGVRVARLAPAYEGGLPGGIGEASAWGVSARFLEFVGLGGMLALLVFRWFAWRPAWRGAGDSATALVLGGRWFWLGFWSLAGVTALAEGYSLVTKTAIALGTGLGGALGSPGEVARVLSYTRFGDLLQIRVALLLAVLAIAFWETISEPPDGVSGRRWPALAIGAGLVGALATISLQGHASQAPLPALSVTADVIHLVAISSWIGGLICLAVVLWRLPRAEPGTGPVAAARVLGRFSGLATVAVGAAVITGVARTIGELTDPSQLWSTGYGRSILLKIALLCPVAVLAFYNRRVLAALAGVPRPNRPTLRMVRRNARIEFALALGIVVVASLLASQTPGRL